MRPPDPSLARQAARLRTGRAAETVVAEWLAAAGWSMIGRNVRVGRAELDIVAVDPGPPRALVIVEVRANRHPGFGIPEATVDRRKLRAVYGAALTIVAAGRLPGGGRVPRLPLRVDLVTVEIGPTLGPEAHGNTIRHLRGLLF